MSVKKLELLDETKFPRAVRKLVNLCARRLNRVWEFRVSTGNALTAKIEETDEKVVVILPRGGMGGETAIVVFAVVNASASGVAKISVTRNGGIIRTPDGLEIVPTIGAVLIDFDPIPVLTVVTGAVYFHVDYTVDPVTIKIENAATKPEDEWDELHVELEQAYKLLAEVTVTSGVATVTAQVVRTSLGFAVADVVLWGSL